MATLPTVAVPPAPVRTEKPKELTGGEQATAALLFVVGLALMAVVFIGFTNDGFTFLSKEVTTTEPTGGPKVTEEKNYADTVVIFALTIGAATTLAGAFYGRIRTLTLGALKLELGEEKEKAQAAAEAAVRENVDDPEKQETLVPAARKLAAAKFELVAAQGIVPSDEVLDQIGMETAEELVRDTPTV